mgnify:FL=1
MISAQDRRPPIDCMYERVILKLNSKTIYKNILKQLQNKNYKHNIYIHAEILPPLLLWVLIMDFRLLLSVRSNLLLSDFPLHDVMRSKSKVDQEKKHEEIIKYMHWLTFSNGTSGFISARTRTF